MKGFQILIILTTLTWWLEATPNHCCPNYLPIVPKQGCMENGTFWIRENCKMGAYAVNGQLAFTDKEDNMEVTEGSDVIPRDKYCVGYLHDSNETIALICFREQDDNKGTNSIIIFICMIVSILCLVLTLAVYILLPQLRDLHGKCIMTTVFCLLFGFTLVSIVQNNSAFEYSSCYMIATGIYFWFVSAFFWMNILAFHIWRTIVNPLDPANEKKTFLFYNLYGWGGPLIILIIATVCYHVPGDHVKPTWTVRSCWFSDNKSLQMYFHIPMMILLTANLIMFILSAWALRKETNTTNNKLRARKFKFVLCFKLFFIMGICWIFEPISKILDQLYFADIWFLTDIVNSLQGLIIFLLLVVFRKRVRRDIAVYTEFLCIKKWAEIASEDCKELSEVSDEFAGVEEIFEFK